MQAQPIISPIAKISIEKNDLCLEFNRLISTTTTESLTSQRSSSEDSQTQEDHMEDRFSEEGDEGDLPSYYQGKYCYLG